MKKTAIVCGLLFAAMTAFSQTASVTSPDGKNTIVVTTEPELSYSVKREGCVYVKPTPIALKTAEHGTLGGAQVLRSEAHSQGESARAGLQEVIG